MREGSQDNKGTYTADIDTAEQKIFDAQGQDRHIHSREATTRERDVDA